MKHSFSISQKIWFSLSILILGYLFSMMQGFFLGKQTEFRLTVVSEDLFPATRKSDSALLSFKEQVPILNDALRLKDNSLFIVAKIKRSWSRNELESLLDYADLEERNLNAAKDAIKLLNDFDSSALAVFEQLNSQVEDSNSSDPTSDITNELSQQSDDILNLLQVLSSLFSDELKSELSDINHVSLRQRHINLYTFIGVVIVALTLISLIIARSVSRPLKKVLMLEKAIEQSLDGISVEDLNRRIIFANQAWATMHGYEPNELIGEDIAIFHTSEQLQNDVLPIADEVDEKGSFKGEVGHKRKDGTIFPSYMTITNLNDKSGKLFAHVATARDISEQKHYEEELKKAKAESEAANLAKSEFLANMSHEIRTPLNGVMGVLNLLLSTELNADQLDLVETGKRSSNTLLTVINDVLDFSKIEAGELDLENIDFNLRNTIEEVVELPAMMAHDKGVEFVYEIHHQIPSFLIGDPARLRQILLNLSNNAIKFTQKGEIFIRAELEEETETHARIRFEVKDTGIGIPDDKLNTIFESFKQTDSSTTRQYGGTGLGLSISKKLAELMEGEIGVTSQLGQGSTFWFTALFEKQFKKEDDHLIPPPDIRGKRFILVDDNKTNLHVLRGYLESWGFSCDVAESADTALSLMNAVAKVDALFDAAIIDMRMPEVDGAELGRRIKANPLLKDLSMVMLTSQGLRGDATRMKDIGFEVYLTKPIRRSQLYNCLVTLFAKKHLKSREQRAQLITKHTITDESRKKIRILIAEDNVINQKIVLRMVENFGFQGDVAANGKEALNALENFKYDVVLMDVQMPEMDGFEASRKIRDNRSKIKDRQIPIIAMTAHAMKGDRERCLEAGMDDYTSKPIQPQELLSAIERQIFEKTQT